MLAARMRADLGVVRLMTFGVFGLMALPRQSGSIGLNGLGIPLRAISDSSFDQREDGPR